MEEIEVRFEARDRHYLLVGGTAWKRFKDLFFLEEKTKVIPGSIDRYTWISSEQDRNSNFLGVH